MPYASFRAAHPGGSFIFFPSGLGGSERRHTALALADVFLSCLGGSELFFPPGLPVDDFLSCLGGSEPSGGDSWTVGRFLSCLGGRTRACAANRSTAISELPGRQN
ncbi:hypothetical protein B9G99_08895 [Kushneria konosiri]|uniref:Uncharacterized protein n=1 Tax=Kushneria konosiri TaxID=698828 RepID=A0A2Z2H6F5_9GAMM|nr:hypothetical protein B9G99_08895 [Kushneria konosiri]